ncbi:MAG: hypothetical protein MRY72_10390 [Aquisalinus sp.]|nr:hypothetical protein [Aquisalinus sp.]
MEQIIALISQKLPDIFASVASSAAYDFLKTRFQGKQIITIGELESALSDFLVINGIDAKADTVMNLLADQGVLQVENSNLHANKSLKISAGPNGLFVVGNNTTTSTDKTAIKAGGGAFMKGQNAAVIQGEDGSVSFHVGSNPGDGIGIYVPKK